MKNGVFFFLITALPIFASERPLHLSRSFSSNALSNQTKSFGTEYTNQSKNAFMSLKFNFDTLFSWVRTRDQRIRLLNIQNESLLERIEELENELELSYFDNGEVIDENKKLQSYLEEDESQDYNSLNP